MLSRLFVSRLVPHCRSARSLSSLPPVSNLTALLEKKDYSGSMKIFQAYIHNSRAEEIPMNLYWEAVGAMASDKKYLADTCELLQLMPQEKGNNKTLQMHCDTLLKHSSNSEVFFYLDEALWKRKRSIVKNNETPGAKGSIRDMVYGTSS